MQKNYAFAHLLPEINSALEPALGPFLIDGDSSSSTKHVTFHPWDYQNEKGDRLETGAGNEMDVSTS